MRKLVIAFREFLDGYNYFFQKTRHRIVRKMTESALQNLDLIRGIEGAKTSAVFEKQHLQNVPFFKTRKNLFEACLSMVAMDGLHLEFGSYKGNSINMLAKLRPFWHFYGFDSFEGLPEHWTLGCRKGAFSVEGRLPAVRENVTLIKGFFDASLPSFVAQHQGKKIGFLHIDCDLYSSTKTVLENLRSMITSGTVICFDEYYNYPDWEAHEHKAWLEFAENYQLKFEYIGYIRMGSQVAVRIP